MRHKQLTNNFHALVNLDTESVQFMSDIAYHTIIDNALFYPLSTIFYPILDASCDF